MIQHYDFVLFRLLPPRVHEGLVPFLKTSFGRLFMKDIVFGGLVAGFDACLIIEHHLLSFEAFSTMGAYITFPEAYLRI